MPLTRRRCTGFEDFAAAQGAGLVKLAYVVSGDRDRAQDAAQEALIRVYQRWPRLADPLAYARRTVVNATRDDWRREQRGGRARRAVEVLMTRVPDPAHPQAMVDDRDALMTAVDALPHPQRAVIVLRYGLELSEAETAATLEIPIGTVKSRSVRALSALRERLTAEPTPIATETHA